MMKNGLSSLLLASSLLASGLTTGCADAGTDETTAEDGVASTEQNLLATAERDGLTLRYYGVEGGGVIELENAADWSDVANLGAELDFVQRYELVAGKKAPEALLAAAAGLGQGRHDFDAVPDVSDWQEPATARVADKATGNVYQGTFTEAEFRSAYCKHTDRFVGGPDTWGLYYTGNFDYDTGRNAEYFKAGAWVYQGNISVKFDFGGTDVGDQWYGASVSYYGKQYVGMRGDSTVDRTAAMHVRPAANTYYLACLNWHK